MRTANTKTFTRIIYPDLSYKINGVLFAVHNERGRFCNEKQYADAVEAHLKKLQIPYEREKVLLDSFDGEKPGRHKVDFLVAGKIVIEIKAKRTLTREDYYQMKRYLVALNKKLGILVNFWPRYIQPKRILNSSASE